MEAIDDRPQQPEPEALRFEVPGNGTVSALWWRPQRVRHLHVLAHGAGAGMTHPFMAGLAGALAVHGVATLRFQFPFVERGSRRVDAPAVAHATVRAAVACAAALAPGVPMSAGGKSYGGRMTSQVQAVDPLPGVRGLAFVGFPLHPAGKPATVRADHLGGVRCPMLFVQGTRDELADSALLRRALEPLHDRATVRVIDGADHGFHVRGVKEAETIATVAEAMAAWFAALDDVEAG